MMVKALPTKKFPVLTVVFFVFWFFSCRTVKEMPKVEARPISTSRLLKKVEQNAFDYNSFTVKRINCQFLSENSRTTFKVNLKAEKDKSILVSISKLNIPVGRVLLTPDSVKYVNYLERNYFVDDYSYLSHFLNIDLDFATIQSIISNNVFSYRNDPKNKDFRDFISYIESEMYVLQSEKEKKLLKIEEKKKPERMERRLKRMEDEALILQKMFFSPANFALTKLVIEDKSNDRIMELLFDDFVKVQNKDYPGAIDMNFISPENKVSLKIRMSGFSTEKITVSDFTIPEKYQQIRVN